MGYAVLHLDKASGNEAKMTAHIERTQMPKNADPERTHLNRELIEFPEGVNTRTEAIQYRIDNAGLTRKVGINQVRAIRIMLTGSHEDMNRIVAEGRLDEWCNDSLDCMREIHGADNLVSAVLHMDEATPHIHATVVPIVTGERRKVKEQKKKEDEPGKKKYRKKSPDAARLCADDIMTRKNLERFQDTYAEAMKKYGLERGIRGSEARHITTQEFYRNAIARQGNLQENIEELLKIEELKRESVEQLKQREQDAQTRFEQADTLKQQKESELSRTEAELKDVKGQLKTEKLKSSAADAGSAIIDGISSALGTSKVKRQQQEIESLKAVNQNQQQEIVKLNQTINRERQENQKTIGDLKAELNKVYEWLPDAPTLIKWGEHCKKIGFSDSQAKDLVNMKPVRFTGGLYSNEHSQRFRADSVEARLEKRADGSGSFRLLIDKINIVQWFRQKYQGVRQAIRPQIKPTPPTPKKGQGL